MAIQVFKEKDMDNVQLGSSPGVEPMLEKIRNEILEPGKAALLSEVVKEIAGADEKKSALSGKIRRYCGEAGKGGFKIVSKDGRNVLVRTA